MICSYHCNFINFFRVSDAKNTTDKKKESKDAKDSEEKETVTADDSPIKTEEVPSQKEGIDSSEKELPEPSKTGES